MCVELSAYKEAFCESWQPSTSSEAFPLRTPSWAPKLQLAPASCLIFCAVVSPKGLCYRRALVADIFLPELQMARFLNLRLVFQIIFRPHPLPKLISGRIRRPK